MLPFRETISETVRENCMMCRRRGCIFFQRWKYEDDSNELPQTAVIFEFICSNFLIPLTIMCAPQNRNVCFISVFCICFLFGHEILILYLKLSSSIFQVYI